jgi:hypothetical protein
MAWITVTDDETTAAIVHSVGAIVVLVVATVAIDRSFEHDSSTRTNLSSP